MCGFFYIKIDTNAQHIHSFCLRSINKMERQNDMENYSMILRLFHLKKLQNEKISKNGRQTLSNIMMSQSKLTFWYDFFFHSSRIIVKHLFISCRFFCGWWHCIAFQEFRFCHFLKSKKNWRKTCFDPF